LVTVLRVKLHRSDNRDVRADDARRTVGDVPLMRLLVCAPAKAGKAEGQQASPAKREGKWQISNQTVALHDETSTG